MFFITVQIKMASLIFQGLILLSYVSHDSSIIVIIVSDEVVGRQSDLV